MEKRVETTYGGTNSKVGDLLVNRLIPNYYVQAVGPFVFLDHLYPTIHEPKRAMAPTGEFAHPHRGIATFSYLFSGALEHFDSAGNHGIVESGGAQWMKAGSGVVHDEHNSPAFQETGGTLHALQFWINLPAANKTEAPEYQAIQSCQIPELQLPGDAGVMRVLIGTCGMNGSPVKSYTQQFIYHIRLNPKSSFLLEAKPGLEYAALIPADEVHVNKAPFSNSEMLSFANEGSEILLANHNITPADVIVFGGEPYTESIMAEGPFVMNSRPEIIQAYKDFHLGKYGQIDYELKENTTSS